LSENVKIVPRLPLLLVILVAGCSGARPTPGEELAPVAEGIGTLIVEVTGLRNTDGTVNLSLFRSSEGFPQDAAGVFRSAIQELSETGPPVFRFENLEFGHYALSMLHDANSNGKLDTSLLGVPMEGFGFSNNPRIGFGAPSFEACRFRFDTPEVILRLTMRYF
jgi:uncharacterized protein (DUF2141 family)